MRRAVAGFWWSPTIEGTPALIVTVAFFALGSLAGFCLAFQTADAGAEALASYLDHFLNLAQTGGLDLPALPGLFWRTVRWPLAAFFLGFTALGLICIPALSSLRGFFLAFSIASFAQAYGREGLTTAFLLLGIPGLVTIPVFFLLTTQSFAAAWNLSQRGTGQGRRELPYHRDYFFRCGLCAGAVCASLFFERYIVPVLIMGISGALRG